MMNLLRQNSNLIITDFPDNQIPELKETCSLKYRDKTLTGTEIKNIERYTLSNGKFITDMAFLHEILSNFEIPEENIQIPSMPKVPFPISKKFTLWREQINILRQWWDQGGRACISLPTGAGKSYIGLAAISLLNLPTLIVAPKEEIQRTVWFEGMTKKLDIPRQLIGFFDGEHKQIRPFTIAVWNSAYLHIDMLKDKFEFVIFDESHHHAASKFMTVSLSMCSKFMMGLSATIKRMDRNEDITFKTVGHHIQGPNFEELADSKRISPVKHEVIYTELTSGERKAYEFQQLMMKNSDNPGNKMRNMIKAQMIALSSKSKTPEIIRLVFRHRNEKILIFTRYVEQAKYLDRVLKPFKTNLILGETKKPIRRMVFEKFSSEKKAILISTSVIDEGVNVPDANIAIVVSGFGTPIQNIQRTGRTVRFLPDKVAKVYEIVSKDTCDESQYLRRNNFF